MRIDVARPDARLESELDALHARLRARRRLRGEPTARMPRQPDMRLWRYEADGEFYVYVVDAGTGRLAGCTVFNRLVEVDRRLDRIVRSPHSRYRAAYQRRGLASFVYQHELEAGTCLVSGARQSAAAHALWLVLGRRYEVGYARLRDKRLEPPDPAAPDGGRDDLDTRMVLCGRGWTLADLMHAGGPY